MSARLHPLAAPRTAVDRRRTTWPAAQTPASRPTQTPPVSRAARRAASPRLSRGAPANRKRIVMSTLHKTLPGVSVRRAALLLLPVALAGAMIAVPPATAQAPSPVAVPAATLSEVNVPGTSPMSATAVDLAAAGYTAREFYAEGQANRYAGATTGTLTTASVLDVGNPYRTRVMVRYPKADKFNGTLAVEWTNVTIGIDFEFAAAEASEYLLREGSAVAVVSAQSVGVERSKHWSH